MEPIIYNAPIIRNPWNDLTLTPPLYSAAHYGHPKHTHHCTLDKLLDNSKIALFFLAYPYVTCVLARWFMSSIVGIKLQRVDNQYQNSCV
jgi:hypothetical protein